MIRSGFFVSVIFLTFIHQINAVTEDQSCEIEQIREHGACKRVLNCPGILQFFKNKGIKAQICSHAKRTICCPHSLITARSALFKLNPTMNAVEPNVVERISSKKCREYSQYNYETVSKSSTLIEETEVFHRSDRCMRSSIPLIVNGVEAQEGEFPHHVYIGHGHGRPNEYHCGGSLVSEKFVLTAAHCFKSKNGPARFVKIGNIEIDQTGVNVKIFVVKRMIPHPKHSRDQNDIGLIEIKGKVEITERTIPACLPQKPMRPEKAVVIGMGSKGFGRSSSSVLLKAEVEYFQFEECQNIYEPRGTIENDTTMCYGHHKLKNDACGGDSGGSLQIINPDEHCTYTVFGVVSSGPSRCGTTGKPGFYVNVFHFLDWIEKNVWGDSTN